MAHMATPLYLRYISSTDITLAINPLPTHVHKHSASGAQQMLAAHLSPT